MISILESLRSLELLKDLPNQDLEHLSQFCMLRQVRAGETVFRQSEPSPYCYGVVSGEITILKEPTEKTITPKVLSVLGPGVLFGEQALFADSPRAATAQAKQDGLVVAIQGKPFREWIARDKENGLKLLIGMLQSTLSRLRQTSDELSVVYSIGRILAADKPILERLREAVDCLKNNLNTVDEIILYQRSPYWEEFQPLVDIPSIPNRPALSTQEALISTTLSATGVRILKPSEVTPGNAAVAVVPLWTNEAEKQTLQGFLCLSSKTNLDAFSSHILLLLSAVSVQFTEVLLQQQRQEDSKAQTRLQQSRQSFQL